MADQVEEGFRTIFLYRAGKAYESEVKNHNKCVVLFFYKKENPDSNTIVRTA